MIQLVIAPMRGYEYGGSPILAILGIILMIGIFTAVAYMTKDGAPKAPRIDLPRARPRKADKDVR